MDVITGGDAGWSITLELPAAAHSALYTRDALQLPANLAGAPARLKDVPDRTDLVDPAFALDMVIWMAWWRGVVGYAEDDEKHQPVRAFLTDPPAPFAALERDSMTHFLAARRSWHAANRGALAADSAAIDEAARRVGERPGVSTAGLNAEVRVVLAESDWVHGPVRNVIWCSAPVLSDHVVMVELVERAFAAE
ncbi:MAG: hypothetical protein ACYDHH_23885 [Solirubrobacteraceae bacterium]